MWPNFSRLVAVYGDGLHVRSVSAFSVRLSQDRPRYVLESGTSRVCEVPKIDQKGKTDYQVNPGSEGENAWKAGGGKCLKAGKPAERWVSKNIRMRSQADTDSCNGLFDTRAGPMAGVSRLSKKRALSVPLE
jgi:hypothetical protein